jgi:uncharacterized membrane protein
MRRIIVICFLTLLVFAVAQAFWHFTHLPAQVASRFDFSGRPVSWMPRAALLGWQLFAILFIAGLLEGIARLNHFIPDENINLPHREYWLSPERRQATLDWLETMVRCSACGVLLLFIVLFHQVFRANVTPGDLTLSTGMILGAVLVGLAALVIACWVRFGRRPS